MFKPMLAASEIPKLENLNYPVLASPKYDGIRCVIINGVAYSRNLKLIPNIHVRETLAKLPLDNLDGELMVSGEFNSVQAAIMSEHGKPEFTFNVFDCFAEPTKTYARRLADVAARLRSLEGTCVKLVPQYLVATPEHLANTLTLALALGYEGLIVRSPHAPYKYGRSTLNQGWMLKLKEFLDAEAEIIGIEELLHNENPAEIGELGQTKHSHEKAGLVGGGVLGSFVCRWRNTYFNLGTGFNAQQRKEYYTKDCIGKLAKFKYQGVGPNNKPRFPVFLGFRHKDDIS